MKAVVAHPGTQHSGRLAHELHRLGHLKEFHTGFAFSDSGLLQRATAVLPRSWTASLSNRRVALPSGLIHTYPSQELRALWRRRSGMAEQDAFHERNERFQRRIPDAAIDGADAIVGFDTSSWILAERAARRGVPLLLDQSIGHPDSKARVYRVLRERYPGWAHDAETRLPEVLAAEKVEHESARLIVVPSAFAKGTLAENGIEESRVRVNPFGVDATRFTPRPRPASAPMRFVFVGALTVRKGIPQLLDAWRRMNAGAAELWLIGPAAPKALELVRAVPNVVYKGVVPNSQLPALLQQCDVFVFPTFFEGFARVIPEAMACGLPVLATTAAGADVVRDGECGWIIAPGDDEALLERLDHCARSRSEVIAAGAAARKAAEGLTWERYAARWASILAEAAEARACS